MARNGWWLIAPSCAIGPAVDNIESRVLDELVVTDTFHWVRARECSRIRVLSVAEMLWRKRFVGIAVGESVSSLYVD